jgi:type II secretory pathway component PulF
LPALYRLPFIGPLLRWGQMARFSRLMALLLEQKTPLPDSLRLASKGLSDAYLALACRESADCVESGRPLSECLAERPQFSPHLIPMITIGERASTIGEAFQSAAEMFEGQANTQGRNLETFLLPAAFLAIICFCGLFIIGIFMPLIALMVRLTSW